MGRLSYPPIARIISIMYSDRVAPEFIWYAFKKGDPVVLMSGCHCAACHYIDANRGTVRRADGLWDGLEKAGLRPERLLLKWCSAAEGARWQTIMQEAEKKQQSVTPEEIDQIRTVLRDGKTPKPRNPRAADENQETEFACLRCGKQWKGTYRVNDERICPQCRSNSVHWLKIKETPVQIEFCHQSISTVSNMRMLSKVLGEHIPCPPKMIIRSV